MKRLRDILIAILCIPYLLFFVFWCNWGGHLFTRLTGRTWYPPK